MLRDVLEAFAPHVGRPLIIEFVNYLHESGYSTELSFGFWDFLVYHDADEPVLAVKTVRNAPTEAQITKLVTDSTPSKVLLIDGPNPRVHQVKEQGAFLAATGTGAFVRGYGWVILPGSANLEVVGDVRLRLSPRWLEQEDGSFLKACTKCGELLTVDDFYRNPYPTMTDPYRNVCKSCFAAERKALRARQATERRAKG